MDARMDVSGGMLPGAVAISNSEIKGKLSMIPKDKEIIIHCNTGILASSAYDTLVKQGYKVRYLNAIVQIDPEMGYEITAK